MEAAGYDAAADSSSVPDAAVADTPTADASSASPVSDPSSDAAQTAASPTETPLAAEPPPGPLPYDRHKAILEKTRAEHKAEMEALAWAQQVPAEVRPQLPRLIEMATRVQGDPVGFLMELAAEVQNDPRHAAALKSHAARMLGTRAPQAPTAVEIPAAVKSGVPELDALLEARDRWNAERLAEQLTGVIQERVGPLTELTERVREAEAKQAAAKQAEAFATTHFEKVSQLPGFKEHQAEISAAFDAEIAKVPRSEWDNVSPIVLRDVYNAVVLPKLTSTSNQTLLKTLTAKASAASLGTTPTVAATATRPRSMREAFSQAGLS